MASGQLCVASTYAVYQNVSLGLYSKLSPSKSVSPSSIITTTTIIMIMMSQGVAVYISPNHSSSFSIVTEEDFRGQNVLHFNLFPLLRDCSTVAQPYQCCSNEPLLNH